jgi:hypothetical protein
LGVPANEHEAVAAAPADTRGVTVTDPDGVGVGVQLIDPVGVATPGGPETLTAKLRVSTVFESVIEMAGTAVLSAVYVALLVESGVYVSVLAYAVPAEPVNEQVAVAAVPLPLVVRADTVTGPPGAGVGVHVIEPVGTGPPLFPDTVAVYE